MDISANDLLVLLPIGTAGVLAGRALLGVTTIGTFAPALLALTILQLGPSAAAAALALTLGVALVTAPVLDTIALPRPARLAALMTVIVGALVGTGVIGEESSAAPVVVLAIVAERTWDAAQSTTACGAARLFATTVVVSFVIAFALGIAAEHLTSLGGLVSAALGLVAIVLVGQYRGLRLNELSRFRPVLEGAR